MKIKKRMILVGMIVIMGILLQSKQVNAALQSNGGTPATKSVNTWLAEIRQMQAAGGALGLTDTINYNENNTSICDLKSNNTNLDIHLEKNTEYGAMAILSVSSYGNPNNIADGDTTTGNKTGVVMRLNGAGEAVAAAKEDYPQELFQTASGRYKNYYTVDNSDKPTNKRAGDALDISNWQSGAWYWFLNQNSSVVRARRLSIFSVGNFNDYISASWNFTSDSAASSRAVVVVGTGI